MLGLQPLAVKLLATRVCVRDGCPKGREGRWFPALGPLGGGMPKARDAKTYLYVFMSEPRNSVPRQPAPAQQGNAPMSCLSMAILPVSQYNFAPTQLAEKSRAIR